MSRTRPAEALPSNVEPVLGTVRAQGIEVEREFVTAFQKLCRYATQRTSTFESKILAAEVGRLWTLSKREVAGKMREPLRFGRGEKQQFTAANLRPIARSARELKDQIEKLKQTDLVFYLNITGKIPPYDLLSFPIMGDPKLKALDSLMNLPKLAGSYNRRDWPRVSFRLWKFCAYVRASTGRWNDSLVVSILNPLKIPHCESADALKMFRTRMSERGTPNASKSTV
jgi:hypothetical protein